MNKKGSKHLLKANRNTIQECLAKNTPLKEISKLIDKDERTISKEIAKRRQKIENKRYFYNRDDRECKTLKRFPWVCNGCSKRNACFKQYKYLYDADYAQENYEIVLKTSREGIDMAYDEKVELDTVLKTGVDKGQSPYHIVKSNSEKITCSLRTVYRYIDKNITSVKAIDLQRKVKFKPRKHVVVKNKDNLAIRTNRTYEDFLTYYANYTGMGLVEIDTVIGQKEGKNKCLLTVHFTITHFCFAILLDSKDKECVSKVFLKLQQDLGKETYAKLFFICLTDRGTEFVDPDAIEVFQETNERIVRLFYCDSYCSYQKGEIEENHTLIRCIIPNGTSMNNLTQEKVDLMMSHINSYERKSISTTPYKLQLAYYGEEFLKKIRIVEINPKDVTLKPALLK